MIETELDSLLKARFKGAVNIRGIRYQIIYSLYRAFDLYNEEEGSFLRPEGIEDVDLIGIQTRDEYIQVKTSINPWKWHEIKEPVRNFADLFRAEPETQYTLAVNFELRKGIKRLADLESLTVKDRKNMVRKFRDMCKKIDVTADEADAILKRLKIISITEQYLIDEIRIKMADTYGIVSRIVDYYILIYISRFLEWAEKRKSVTRMDLDNLNISFRGSMAREKEFEAYGRGLINRISWEPDQSAQDFFDGSLLEYKKKEQFWMETFIPVEIPREIWDLLPSFPFSPPPGLELFTSVAAITGAIEASVNYATHILPLASSRNASDIQLYSKHESRLGSRMKEIISASSQTLELLQSSDLSNRNKSCYGIVHDFLDSLVNMSSLENLFDYIRSEGFNGEKIFSAAMELSR